MVSQLPKEVEYIIANEVNAIPLTGHLKTKEWTSGRKYEENVLYINLRSIDPNGTLEQVKTLERSTNRYVPETEIVSGCLVVRLRRELP